MIHLLMPSGETIIRIWAGVVMVVSVALGGMYLWRVWRGKSR